MPPLRLTPIALAVLMLPSALWAAENLPPLSVNPALLDTATASSTPVSTAASSASASAVADAPVASAVSAPPAAPTNTPAQAETAPVTSTTAAAASAVAAETETPPFVPGPVLPKTTVLIADSMRGTKDHESEATGDAELHQGTQSIYADQLTYFQPENRVLAEGHVKVTDTDTEATGPYLEMQLDTHTGYMQQPVFTLHNPEGHGDAHELQFAGENVYGLDAARYTTCDVGREDWYLRAKRLDLDRNTQIGVAHSAYLTFKGVPVMYTPWMDFPLNNQRKSGFLTPKFALSGKNGTEITLPYYWNIAPNMDATLTPRLMAKRGLQLGGEFRYLERNYNGQIQAEYLPQDQVYGKERSAITLLHNQTIMPGLFGWVNYRSVSDNSYLRDLSSVMAQTSQGNLLQEGGLSYSAGWWQLTGRVQRFQTLQDPLAPIVPPYARLPQITFNALKQNVGLFDLGVQSEWVAFDHPTLLSGQRTVVYPYVSMPWVTPYAFITPKVGVHYTSYALQNNPSLPSATRELPIVSLDSGLTFERPFEWAGRELIQTLEPRLYYLYVPYKDQSQLPVFDTGLASFSYMQLFSENIFTGSDRIANANQLTAAVTSRFINPASGNELVRMALGQRYYFEPQKVTLPGQQARTGSRSDLLATIGGQLAQHVTADAGWQYSPDSKNSRKYNLNVRYMPARGKVLNWGYRFDRGTIDQMDVSAQWPLYQNWYGVARWNYSKLDHKTLESILGLEYNGGCWVLRMVAQSFPTATNTMQTGLFLELEFNGLSSLGTSPVQILRQRISGYAKTNTLSSSPEESNAP